MILKGAAMIISPKLKLIHYNEYGFKLRIAAIDKGIKIISVLMVIMFKVVEILDHIPENS